MTEIESIIDDMTDDEAELHGRVWAMRQYAIEIGVMMERDLVRRGLLAKHKRRFLSAREYDNLTQAM